MDAAETMTENRKFPLLPNYIGPKTGMFGFVHHGKLCEWSDNILKRCSYVETEKPQSELPIRCSHMMYLDPVECPAAYVIKALNDKYDADRKPLENKYWAGRMALDLGKYLADRKALDDKYDADFKPLNAEVLHYLRTQIPDCRWDEKTNQLRFE